MKRIVADQLDRHKQDVEFRTDRLNAVFGPPQLSMSPAAFELATKTQAVAHGGVALVHQLAVRSGLIESLNRVSVLTLKLPYHESDHILNIAYNVLCGGKALEHIEIRRNDPTYLDMLGTHSIPDPTTAGDFCRRYTSWQIDQLQDRINDTRLNVWARQSPSFFNEAVVDMDGTVTPTYGECKQGMDISYKGDWGYHPLIVSLANTNEVLFVRNRSGNRPSHEGAHIYVDKSIRLLRRAGFKKIRFRGDTDFSQTEHLDRWDADGVQFVFGFDAKPKLIDIAERLENTAWERLDRPPKYDVKTKGRNRPENVKERIVEERGFVNRILSHEDYAEIAYRPMACGNHYRLVILRKTITVKKGQELLIPDTVYFFYITNDREKTAPEIIYEANKRCNQENIIAQLKATGALSMPLNTLEANWMYMVATGLAWTLKAWSALWPVDGDGQPEQIRRKNRLLKMEFATYLQSMVTIPAQILRSGRQIIVRLLNINDWTPTFFQLAEQLRPSKKILLE